MADKNDKYPENAPGKFYVDNSCTPCNDCLAEAPMLLKYNDDETKVYFLRQPANEAERICALKAKEICPIEAIGDDGED